MTESSRFRGFSVIELATVMTIIAITAAIAIPMGLNYIRHYEVQGAAQSVASLLQLTRSQAVRRNVRRGLILNFDYPAAGSYQFTSLEEDPVNGGYADPVYQDPAGDFDPGNRNYGKAPVPPNNTAAPANGLSSPHGQVIRLPQDMQFENGHGFRSLLFRVDGSVEAVSPANVPGSAVDQNGMDWQVTVRHPRYGLSRTIRISRSGRVIVE